MLVAVFREKFMRGKVVGVQLGSFRQVLDRGVGILLGDGDSRQPEVGLAEVDIFTPFLGFLARTFKIASNCSFASS